MKHLTVISLLMLSSCFLKDELPPDQTLWGYAKPNEVGFSDARFAIVDQEISVGRFDDIKSLIVIKDDNIIFENYYNNPFRQEIRPIGLMTQTITIALLGSLIEDGFINDLDESISDYLPFYSNIFDAEPEKKEITIRHLLEHKSGIVWNETLFGYLNEANDINRMRNQSSDYAEYVIRKELEAAPGQRLVINSGSAVILSRIIQQALGEIDFRKYTEEKIFSPLGIKNYRWETDAEGNVDGMSGLYLTDIDVAKIGYLFLNYGNINRNRILNENWIFEVTEAQSMPNNLLSLGYGWRIPEGNLAAFLGYQPGELIYTPPHHGQFIVLVPEQNLVFCIYAENYFSGILSESLVIFRDMFSVNQLN